MRITCYALVAIVMAVKVWGADVVVMVGDQPGATGFRDGDILHVFPAAEIARQWAEIDARGEAGQWIGYDRSFAPMSDTMLSQFLVLAVDEDTAQKFSRIWDGIDTDSNGHVLAKRTYYLDWRNRLPQEYHAIVENRDGRIDLRGQFQTVPASWVKKR